MRDEAGVLVAVALGGGLGGMARYGLGLAEPALPGSWPWTTFATNVLGCALIGALAALLAGAQRAHPLVWPFLVVGVLGGFTTFSAYAVQARGLLVGESAALGLGYLLGTLLASVLATIVAVGLTRRAGALPGGSSGRRQ